MRYQRRPYRPLSFPRCGACPPSAGRNGLVRPVPTADSREWTQAGASTPGRPGPGSGPGYRALAKARCEGRAGEFGGAHQRQQFGGAGRIEDGPAGRREPWIGPKVPRPRPVHDHPARVLPLNAPGGAALARIVRFTSDPQHRRPGPVMPWMAGHSWLLRTKPGLRPMPP